MAKKNEPQQETKNLPQGGNGGQLARPRNLESPSWSSPFSFMRRFSEEMDRLFEGFSAGRGFQTPSLWGQGQALMPRGMEADWSPQIDVFQSDDQITIRADLPGLSKDDLKVDVTDDAVTIAGERKQERKEEHEGYYCSERSYGSFFRSIPLPEGAKADQAKANFQNGVLEITMPAPEPQRRGRRIEIQEAAKT